MSNPAADRAIATCAPHLADPLHTDLTDTVSVKQISTCAVASRGVVESLVAGLYAVRIDDPDGEGVLVGVDSPIGNVMGCS